MQNMTDTDCESGSAIYTQHNSLPTLNHPRQASRAYHCYRSLLEDILGIVEFCEVGRTLLEGLHEEFLGIVEFHEAGRTLLKRLHEKSLGIVEYHEVGRTSLEGLHEEILGIVEFNEAGRTDFA